MAIITSANGTRYDDAFDYQAAINRGKSNPGSLEAAMLGALQREQAARAAATPSPVSSWGRDNDNISNYTPPQQQSSPVGSEKVTNYTPPAATYTALSTPKVTWDNTTDYMSIMNSNPVGSDAYNSAKASRDAKLAAGTDQDLASWGVNRSGNLINPAPVQTPQQSTTQNTTPTGTKVVIADELTPTKPNIDLSKAVVNPLNPNQIFVKNGQSGMTIDKSEIQKYMDGGWQIDTNPTIPNFSGISGINGTNPLANANLNTPGGIVQAIIDSMKQNNNPQDYKQIAQDILNQINQNQPSQPQVKKLTWQEALDQAQQMLNPLYDQRMKGVLKATDQDLIKRGFYGQLPGEVLRNETAGNEATARTTAITGMANNLVDKTTEDANTAAQLDMQKQNQTLNVILNAINQAKSNSNTNIGDLTNLLTYLTNQEDKDNAAKATNQNNYTNATGYMPVNVNDIPADSPLRAYDDDYQSQIDKLMATNPNDPTIAYLQALRNAKIMQLKDTDPAAFEQLKGTLTPNPQISTLNKQKYDLDIQAQQIQNNINVLKLKALPQQIKSDLDMAEQQLIIAKEEAKTAPEMASLKLRQIQTQINNMIADNSRADKTLEWAKDPTNPDNIAKSAQVNKSTPEEIADQAIKEFESKTDYERVNWWNTYKGEIAAKSPRAYDYIKAIMEPKSSTSGITWGN